MERLANHSFEFTHTSVDRFLSRDGACVALLLLMFNPHFVGRLVLERLERAGKCADLVVAPAISGIDRQIA